MNIYKYRALLSVSKDNLFETEQIGKLWIGEVPENTDPYKGNPFL